MQKVKNGLINGTQLVEQLEQKYVNDDAANAAAAEILMRNPALAQSYTPKEVAGEIKKMWGQTIKYNIEKISQENKDSGAGNTNKDLSWVVDAGHNILNKQNLTREQGDQFDGTDAYNGLKINKGNDSEGKPQYVTIGRVYVKPDGTIWYATKEQTTSTNNVAVKDLHQIDSIWGDIIEPAAIGTFGTGSSEKLEKLKDYAVQHGVADELGVPYIPDNSQKQPQAPAQEETKIIGDKTYIKKNGQWYQK